MPKWMDQSFWICLLAAALVVIGFYREMWFLAIAWAMCLGASATRWHVNNLE